MVVTQIGRRDADPGLDVVALTEPVSSRSLYLVTRRNAHLSPAARALHDMILETRPLLDQKVITTLPRA